MAEIVSLVLITSR